MGIAGELVRSVFSKTRSLQTHDTNIRSNGGMEKKRWSSMRSYLCGDEHNSGIETEDSVAADDTVLSSFRSNRAVNSSSIGGKDFSTSGHIDHTEEDKVSSMRSSEATVNQLLHQSLNENGENREEKQNSTYKLFQQEDAALIIQSAFRSFRAKRYKDDLKLEDDKKEYIASPSRGSVNTSVEVQTGNSSDIFSIQEESFDASHRVHRRTRSQVLKLQVDWDDSTINSVVSKRRIQNRMEAATRRERALAYAFSQQLRICSKKKENNANDDETNVGWSWMERWMAARQPEEDNCISSCQDTLAKKRIFVDAAVLEEKESCGSNEVSSLIEFKFESNLPKHVSKSAKIRSKVRRNLSYQNSTLHPRESKEMKKTCDVGYEKDKRKRPKQQGNKREIKHDESTTQLSGLEDEIRQ